MDRRKLTDRYIDALRALPLRQRIYDSEVRPLSIRVSPTGLKAFYLQARYPGNPKRYPVERALCGADEGIAEARKKARLWLNAVADGLDPNDAKRRVREEERKRREAERRTAGNTFEAVTALLFASPKHKRKRSKDVVEQRTNNHLLPAFGARPITEIDKHDVRELFSKIAARALNRGGTGRFAHSLWEDCEAVFNFAVKQDLIERSPFEGLAREDVLPPKRRGERVLDPQEIRAYYVAAGRIGVFGSLYRLLMLTCLRLNEAAEAREREFDRNAAEPWWEIPAERMKGTNARAEPHCVPLTAQMLELLDGVKRYKGGDHVFSTPDKFGAEPISGFTRGKKMLVREMLKELRVLKPECAGLKDSELLPRFTMLDVRRTVRSGLSMLRIPDDVSEAIQAHKLPGLKRTYDRYDRFREKRAALEGWGQYLQSVIAPAPDDAKVVPLRRAGRK
jgi:integrase